MANGGGKPGGNLGGAGAGAGKFPANPVNCVNAACKPGKKPPPPPVSPALTAPLVVVVKKKHTNPARVSILLKTDVAFAGKGTFTAAPADTIQFFTSKKGGTAIKFDGKQNAFTGPALTKGVNLFAVGAKASATLNDVVLSLNLAGGPNPIVKNPAQAKMTAIDVSLQICKPRTAAAGDPPTLSEAEKIDPGRALHVQNPASTHLRPMLIVAPVKPAGFIGQLELTTDLPAKGGSVVLFPNEKQTGGEIPSNAMDIPVAGKKVFAEGIAVSQHLKDIKVRLSVKGLEHDADHVILTVIEAKLDLCASRERVDKPPTPLADLDKTALGRSLTFHTADPKPRAMMILRHLKPVGFLGKLFLTPVAAGAGRVRVFEHESGGAAIAGLNTPGTPMEIAHDKTFPAAGLHRFVEGSAVSSAMRDVAFKLGVKDVEDNCDQVNLSIVDVTSLQASLDSTKDAVTHTAPAAGTFSTVNAALAFAAPLGDLMVVILNAGQITVQAQAIKPAAAKTDLHWAIEQDPTDTVAKGVPALDKDTGDQVKITPNTPGTFRLICYCGSNKKPFHDEEVRVLRMVIVKITPQPGGQVTSNNLPGALTFAAPMISTNNAMNLQADFLIEAGGANRRFGLDAGLTQLVLGNLGNVTADTYTVNYPGAPAAAAGDHRAGTDAEDPDFKQNPAAGFPNPMVDSSRVAAGSKANGGSNPFRSHSNQALLGNGPGGKGQLVRVTGDDAPQFVVRANHPHTGNPWGSTQGINGFTEWVVAYTITFQRNYTALGKGGYTVTVIGANDGAGNWIDVASSIVPTAWSTVGFPKTGDAAGVQVLGFSFVREAGSIITP